MFRFQIILQLLLVLLPIDLLLAETISSEEEALLLIQRIGAKYSDASSYLLEGSVETASISEGVVTFSFATAFVFAGRYPDHCRVEMFSLLSEIIKICNGNQSWIYFVNENKYFTGDFIPLDTNPRPGVDNAFSLDSQPTFGTCLYDYDVIPAESFEGLKVLGEDTLQFADKPTPCAVLQYMFREEGAKADSEGHLLHLRRDWIDPVKEIILKSEIYSNFQGSLRPESAKSRTINTYTRALIDETLPDDLFMFTPPAGSEQITDVGKVFAKNNLTDSPLPAIQLQEMDGTEVSLTGFKDKILLLDFWATWCLPCLKELPHIQKLHEEYSDMGLMVIGICNESPEKIKKFLKKHSYTFKVLVDSQNMASSALKVESIPAGFIINQDGIVCDYFVGVQSESYLRAALRKVGIGSPAGVE